MYQEPLFNRHCADRDRIWDTKLYYQRMALAKASTNPPPPKEYLFLKYKMLKKQMQKDEEANIRHGNNLVLNKIREKYKKPGQYHPDSMKFFPHPSSLRFSAAGHKQFEIDKSNEYLNGRIKKIKNGKSVYNCSDSLSKYERLVKIENNIIKNSRYTNINLNFVTPRIYEKRLYKLIEDKKKEKALMKHILEEQKFNTENNQNYISNKNNLDVDFSDDDNFSNSNTNNNNNNRPLTDNGNRKTNKIEIEREYEQGPINICGIGEN